MISLLLLALLESTPFGKPPFPEVPLLESTPFQKSWGEEGKGPCIGVCTSVANDSLLQAVGLGVLEETVAASFNPRNVSEEKFPQVLARIKNARVNVRSANVFFPGSIKLVGPSVNEPEVLGYVDTVMRRARQAGVKIIVLGSGEARRIPQGYDSVTAREQFISLVKKMAEIGERYKVIIAIENLNRTETNFINTLQDAIDIVKHVNHRYFRLTADIYHMLMENEPADHIIMAKDILVNVHIAEREERGYPGRRGTDFTPYFRSLKWIRYKGCIMIESRWGNLSAELPLSVQYLTLQWEMAK